MKKNNEKPIKGHPADIMLADYLDRRLARDARRQVEEHLTGCRECRIKAVAAYESAGKPPSNNRKVERVGKINLYLIFAIVFFVLSFVVPRYFIQLLVATLLLGAKWVADSKSTKMLVMIHEAWKSGGERGASEAIKRFDSFSHNR